MVLQKYKIDVMLKLVFNIYYAGAFIQIINVNRLIL